MNTVPKTFNRALGALPSDAARFTGHFQPEYSTHARRASTSDRYGQIFLPHSLNIVAAQIVEVETVNGRAVKAVVRLPYNNRFDLVLVICDPFDGDIVVKTVWLNESTDDHSTLRTANLQHIPAV